MGIKNEIRVQETSFHMENFKRRTKNRGFLSAFCPSLYNVFIGFSVYGNDELIHRLTLQQSADVLVQKHGYQ